ncbi:MAG: hypothetical protein H7Y17_03785 [Chlorobia bacterium]|nr:hypothetical protein [Fimbriimonadaceae bacterium]
MRLQAWLRAQCARAVRRADEPCRRVPEEGLDMDWQALDELAANAIDRTKDLFQTPVLLSMEGKSPLVLVDGVLLEQVFVNLLENASKHGGNTVAAKMTIRAEATMATVQVDNDGPGIPPDQVATIFDRFQHDAKKSGIGLGLAICKAAVEAHQGRIWAANIQPHGVRFTVELPLGKEPEIA